MKFQLSTLFLIIFFISFIFGIIRFLASNPFPQVGDHREIVGADKISQDLIDKYGYHECYIGSITKWDLWGHDYGPRPLAIYKKDSSGKWFLRLSDKEY